MSNNKRNLLSEIKELKSRDSEKSWDSIPYDLEKLVCGLDKKRLIHKEVLREEYSKYLPIRIVSCFQVFFKLVIKDLIDSNVTFKENARGFNQNISFDTILSLDTENISTGELIAHVLRFNNFDDINRNISIVLKKDFLEEIKKFKLNSKDKFKLNINRKWRNSSEKIIRSVKRAFELRHIFCHEFSDEVEVTEKEAATLLKDSRLFLDQVADYIKSIKYPGIPVDFEEMAVHYGKVQHIKDSNLEKVIEIFKNEFKDKGYDMVSFESSMINLKVFKDHFSHFVVSQFERGGEIYDFFKTGSAIGITQSLTDFLVIQFSIMKKAEKK